MSVIFCLKLRLIRYMSTVCVNQRMHIHICKTAPQNSVSTAVWCLSISLLFLCLPLSLSSNLFGCLPLFVFTPSLCQTRANIGNDLVHSELFGCEGQHILTHTVYEPLRWSSSFSKSDLLFKTAKGVYFFILLKTNERKHRTRPVHLCVLVPLTLSLFPPSQEEVL